MTDLEKQQIFELIKQAKEGKQSAFTRLYNRFSKIIYNTIYYIVNNKDVADDLLSVTFTKAFKKISTYTNPISFEMWLKTIAINTAIDYIRKMKNEKQNNYIDDTENNTTELQEYVPSTEDVLIQKEEHKALMEAMATLRSNYKEILKLRFIDELSYRDIATKLGLSEITVKSQLFKAKQKLRSKIKQLENKSQTLTNKIKSNGNNINSSSCDSGLLVHSKNNEKF